MERLRILCCNPDGGAFFYITKGWENAFKALGHDFKRWDGKDSMLRSYRPNLYLGCSGWRQNFPEWAKNQFGTKIGIHVNPWGTVVLKANPGEPNINEPQGAKDWTIQQKPDFVYGYANQFDMNRMWNYWTEKAGIPVVPMPTAGDSTVYQPTNPDPTFSCQIGFVGGYWPYKSININKFLMPVLNKYDSQIYGWGGWKHPKYKGRIQNEGDVNKLFSTAKICPSITEPHTTRYGIDIPERMFKVPLGGGFTICDPVVNLDKYVDPKIFPTAANPQTYMSLIEHYLNHPAERMELKSKQRDYILKNHTYFHRIKGFLSASGYDQYLTEIDQKINELIR